MSVSTVLSWIALLAIGVSVAAVGAPRAQAQVLEYNEMCEASAAVAAGPDHFFAAEDEKGWLRLYARNKAEPVWRANFRKKLGVDIKDIEGAAAIDNRIFWITSHGQDGGGNDDPDRRYLFATDIVGQGANATLEVAGTAFGGLREALLEVSELKALGLDKSAKIKPKKQDGFNIEGLAAAPGRMLWIGFRNPIPDGRALIVPLENPEAVVMGTAKPIFGKALRPDLDGLGIRSIDRVGDAYVIVAGPFDKSADFSLRRWSGASNEKPLIISDLSNKGPKFTPEALFAIPGTNKVQILSDDGDFWQSKHDDQECKDAAKEQKRFRSIIVTP